MNDLNELFLMVGETRATVQRIEAQVTALSTLPDRLSALETWRKRLLAGTAAVCTLVGFALQLLVSKL